MTKTQQISALIAAEFARNGGDIAKALDAVCGAGTYAKLASEVYNELRAKQGL